MTTNNAQPENPSVDLTWENLTYTVDVKDENGATVPKVLLKGVSGTARSGRTLAVMGPSGAGKSTFLNGVCGRLAVNKSLRLEGVAYLDNVLFVPKYKPLISYVAQDDIVMGKDTPREALAFSYRMRSGASAEETESVVTDMLEKLSLTKCADTLLGIPGLIKGVSGGEKKRTNIGAELINNPMILLLDEPTTGLDSVNALRVGQLLRNLAREDRRTVMCTIHTPSSELYDVFDDVLLLAKGSVVYHGPCKEAPAYFASIGYPVPHRMNPSEHFMTLLQLEESQLNAVIQAWSDHVKSDRSRGNLSVNNSPDPTHVVNGDVRFDRILKFQATSAGTELALLTARSWRTTMRDPAGTIGKLVQTLFFAVLLALFFANMKKNDDGVTDRSGTLFMEVLNLTFLNVMSAIAVFPPERAVFLQEQTNAMYTPAIYYVSKVIAELPLNIVLPTIYVIITYFSWDLALNATAFFNHWAGALAIAYCGNAFGLFAASLFPKPEIAMTITPLMIMPQMIVGGLFANTERLEPYWIWLNYVAFPRYGYKAFMINEFTHIEGLCPDKKCRYTNGQEVLTFYGFDKPSDTFWFNVLMICVLMVVFRIIGAIGLTVQGAGQRSQLVFEGNFKALGRTAQSTQNDAAIELRESAKQEKIANAASEPVHVESHPNAAGTPVAAQ